MPISCMMQCAACMRCPANEGLQRPKLLTVHLISSGVSFSDRRLTLYSCSNGQAADALSALAQLPQLRTLALTIHSGWGGTKADPLENLHVEDWEDWVYPNPMAQLAGCLTALTLASAVR